MMNKMWAKRDESLLNNYKPSIFRQKKKLVLIVFVVIALLFFFYQFLFISQLTKSEQKVTEIEQMKLQQPISLVKISPLPVVEMGKLFNDHGLVRGIRLMDLQKYKPDADGMFTCVKSNVKINFSFVNDDYCDCPEDGSDEPGTNACKKGQFFCRQQTRHKTGRGGAQFIPSSRVNDGICDCCDGSDEWNKVSLVHQLPMSMQAKIHRYQTPCTNTCLKS